MEDNRPNQDLTNQDIEFIKEKVKERPLNRRKLFKKTLLTASMAAFFGLIACVTFLVLEPVFSTLSIWTPLSSRRSARLSSGIRTV